MFNTPILFIIFNRPGVTRVTFDRIRALQPPRLFIAADGPRAGNLNDEIKCSETRAIVAEVNWPCQIKTLFRDQNLGCGKGVSSAITWFFGEVEQGIILEDDCLPDLSFFYYCQILLEYHKNNNEVFHIGGINFQQKKWGDGSYYFSAATHVWGWASWRRAWKHYDFDVKDLDAFKKKGKIKKYFDDKLLARYWYHIFDEMFAHRIDTWDNQWNYTIMNNGGVSIVPNVNLVSNLGFDGNATHTVNNSQYARKAAEKIELPLSHPATIKINKDADFYFYNVVDNFSEAYRQSKTTLFYEIKRRLLFVIEKLLTFFILKRKAKNPGNNVLIVKTDALGDYTIGRNFLELLAVDENFNKDTIYLLAHIRLRPLIEVSDKSIFREVIYFDPLVTKKFKTLYNFYFKLRSFKFRTVIYPVYSRSKQIDDILNYCGALNLIGFKGDTSNQSSGDKLITDQYYTELIDVDALLKNAYAHEFVKQKTFFSQLLKKKPEIEKPIMQSEMRSSAFKTISICPGAQEKLRTWPVHKFRELLILLQTFDMDFQFNIITGPGEGHLFDEMQRDLPFVIQHVAGENFASLFTILKSSNLIVCNDSAPAHFSVALGVHSVCISNGNHYGRFVPYPESIQAQQQVVFPGDFLTLVKEEKYARFFYKSSSLEIDKISTEQVYNACVSALT